MMASQVPPALSSSQSSRFKSAITTVVVAGRVRRTIETSSTSRTLPTPSISGAAASPNINPSSASGTSARNYGPAGSKDAATSSARRSATLSSSKLLGSNQTAGARVDTEVGVVVESVDPTVKGKDFLSPLSNTGVSTGTQSPNKGAQESGIAAAETSSALRAEFVAMPVNGANHAGPGEVEDKYNEPAAWFVPANTKLHTGSKLFWRIKRTIDFKLYV